jgi:hypothetical protein
MHQTLFIWNFMLRYIGVILACVTTLPGDKLLHQAHNDMHADTSRPRKSRYGGSFLEWNPPVVFAPKM